jgi:hypothetical protein
LGDDVSVRRGALPFDPTPETEESYELARSLLKESFASWGVANAKELETDAGEAPIHYKWAYLDGHLTRWRCVDLDRVYLELHPAKVIVEKEDLASVLDEARAFIAFLDEVGWLDLASDDRDVLLDHLGRIEPTFYDNMADTARYSAGKKLWTSALAEGVRLGDEAAVQSFMASFNARSLPEREAVLGRAPSEVSRRTPSGRATPPGTPPRPKQPSASRRRKRR